MNDPSKAGPKALLARALRRAGRAVVIVSAVAFILQVAVGLFGMPWRLVARLTGDDFKLEVEPRYVVVLGGGGIPSESGLIRTYYAAAIGTNLPGATFVVSLPSDGDPATNSVGRMRDELVLRGIPASAVRLEYRSFDTHEQAVSIARLLGSEALAEPVLIVTSPYHAKRALLCFRKAGFRRVACLAAVGIGPEADFGAGLQLNLRYAFWANLEAEVEFAREIVALAYYKLRGWI
ncbi:MAG: YdcF family protein [Verrucomicrobiota bacterium]